MVKKIESFCKLLLAILMSLLVMVVFFQVLNRFLFHVSAAWTEEMGRFVFIWTSVIGAALAVNQRAHIGLTIIVNLFPDKIKKLFLILAEIVMIGFYSFLVFWGSNWAFYGFQETSESLMWLPMFYVYMCIPFAGLLMLIFSSNYLFRILTNKIDIQTNNENMEEY
jgi:TRAP-type C4-dicarboxylate transport system permease small subunit